MVRRLLLALILCASAFAQSANVTLVRVKPISATQNIQFYIASGFDGTKEAQVPFSVTVNNSDSASTIFSTVQDAAVTALGTVGVTVTASDLALPLLKRASGSIGIGDVDLLPLALSNRVLSSDSRLSDARSPLAHTHLWGEITNPPATYAPSVHGQAAHDSSVTQNIAGGTATFATTPIAAGACSANATISATSGSLGNIGAADAVYAQSYKSAPGTTDGRFIINVQVAAGAITITRCNPTAASLTGTAIVLNWKVVR